MVEEAEEVRRDAVERRRLDLVLPLREGLNQLPQRPIGHLTSSETALILFSAAFAPKNKKVVDSTEAMMMRKVGLCG